MNGTASTETGPSHQSTPLSSLQHTPLLQHQSARSMLLTHVVCHSLKCLVNEPVPSTHLNAFLLTTHHAILSNGLEKRRESCVHRHGLSAKARDGMSGFGESSPQLPNRRLVRLSSMVVMNEIWVMDDG